MMDRTTFQPYSDIISIAESSVRVTDEAKAKRKAGLKIREQDETVKLLDDLITKKAKKVYWLLFMQMEIIWEARYLKCLRTRKITTVA